MARPINGVAEISQPPRGARSHLSGELYYSFPDINLAIPDANSEGVQYDFYVDDDVPIADLAIRLDISHTWVGDLLVKLEHPDGTKVVLWNREGGDTDDIHQTFGSGGIQVAGLWTLQGKQSRGTWSISVSDEVTSDEGTLDGFSLTIFPGAVPPPNTDYVDVDTSEYRQAGFWWSPPDYSASWQYRLIYTPGTQTLTEFCPTGGSYTVVDDAIGTLNEYYLAGLSSGTTYSYRLCTLDPRSGEASRGVTGRFTTLREPLPPTPRNLSAISREIFGIELSWELQGSWQEGSIEGYRYGIAQGETSQVSCDRSAVSAMRSLHFSGLHPDTAYSIVVCAINGNVPPDSGASQIFIARTPNLAYLDRQYYLARNPDATAAIAQGESTSPLDHLYQVGYLNKYRDVSPLFDVSFYLAFNSDLRTNILSYDLGPFLHYYNETQAVNRQASPYFDPTFYRTRYPEVPALIGSVYQTLAHHFWIAGLGERRRGSWEFDEAYYLDTYPDVAGAVADHTFGSGLVHYLLYGKSEGRFAARPGEKGDMFRAYNPGADYHFFTTRQSEYDNAVAHGYQAEGAPFQVFLHSEVGLSPLYRLYNLSNGRHYYTAAAGEKDSLVSAGWRLERIEGYVAPEPRAGLTELFRLYNRNSGTHLFTTNAQEKDIVLTQFGFAWEQHASVGYVPLRQ